MTHARVIEAHHPACNVNLAKHAVNGARARLDSEECDCFECVECDGTGDDLIEDDECERCDGLGRLLR